MSRHCGATTRAGGRCRRPSGWGTEHPGTGRCKLHGGASSGPKDQSGNKNAVVTGAYETIWLDQLDADERALYDRIDTDGLSQLAEEIRLTTIRERRMLARVATLARADFTVVERALETKQGVEAGDADEDDSGSVFTTKQKVVEEATLGQIQRIEEALTRVQQRKAHLIELWHKLQAASQDDNALSGLVAAIEQSRQLLTEKPPSSDV